MKLENLQRYVPDELFLGDGIQYFKSESGEDWFKSLPLFKKKYSLAIDNDNGVIKSISEDTSMLYPVGLTVVDIDTLPEGCDISGAWRWSDDAIHKITPDFVDLAERNKLFLLKQATDTVSTLSDAVELGIATEQETSKLHIWKTYRVLLSRIDTSLAPNITWPEIPSH